MRELKPGVARRGAVHGKLFYCEFGSTYVWRILRRAL